MQYFILIIFVVVGLVLIFWQLSLLIVSITGAPTVYANNQAIKDAFKLANLQKNELVLDLGCGNAKSLIIAAREFGARGVGVEISPYCFLKSKLNVFLSGQNTKVKIIFGDFKKAEKYLKKADVVYFYLLNKVLEKIEDWYFSSINKKARTVVLSFHFKNHKQKLVKKTKNLNRDTVIYLY